MTLDEVEGLVGSRLREIGLNETPDIMQGPGGTLTISYEGRDPSGHSCRRRIEMPCEGDATEFAAALDARLAAQRRFATRAGRAPVRPGPAMELGHLLVNGPLARRLRLDHGGHAGDALRQALASLIAGGSRRLEKQERPYGLVLNANRLDHREPLGPGAEWKGRALVLRGLELPEQVADSLPGRPASDLIEHEVLEGQMIVSVHVSRSGRSGPCLVAAMDGEWIAADGI